MGLLLGARARNLHLWVFLDINTGMALKTDALSITPQILSLISGLDEFKGARKALGTLAPERLSALRRVATIERHGSYTRIEGAKLSDRVVERLLSTPDTRPLETRDDTEVEGHEPNPALAFAPCEGIEQT